MEPDSNPDQGPAREQVVRREVLAPEPAKALAAMLDIDLTGGRVRTHRPLRLGREATRTTWALSTEEKIGRTGPLTFVTVRSDISQDGQVVIEDEQDIVYRAPDSTLAAAAQGEAAAPRREPSLTLNVDSTLLFRFSALTYNAHRIHYDHEYVRQEGYDDLVVHGPLQRS